MGEIFISYSRLDRKFVDTLIPALEEQRFSVWVDRHDILGGESWGAAIPRAIAQCEALVLVLSPNSATSENVLREVAFAESRNRRIIPIVHRKCELMAELDFRLTLLERIDFSRRFDNGLGLLIRAMQANRESTLIDHSSEMSKVRNQESEGSVIGFALSYALEFQIWRSQHKHVVLSPRYIYYEARKEAGLDLNADTGAPLRAGLAVLKTKGAVLESAWPYKPREFDRKPPRGVSSATRFRIRNYVLKGSIDEVKAGLRDSGPLVASVSVYSSFMQDVVRRTGEFRMPGERETLVGGHTLCLVGYDDKAFKFINSWGEDWGDHGYGYIRFPYYERLVSEVWEIKT